MDGAAIRVDGFAVHAPQTKPKRSGHRDPATASGLKEVSAFRVCHFQVAAVERQKV